MVNNLKEHITTNLNHGAAGIDPMWGRRASLSPYPRLHSPPLGVVAPTCCNEEGGGLLQAARDQRLPVLPTSEEPAKENKQQNDGTIVALMSSTFFVLKIFSV